MSGGIRTEVDAAASQHARHEWVDVARGLGIIAVVVGHVWTRGPVREAMYSFHMPLFFLLSGYLFAPRPAGPFARQQIAAQGLSYAAFLILLVAADIVIETLKGQRPIFSDWPGDILPILHGGSALTGPFTVFWFVPCLLAARLILNGLAGHLGDPLRKAWLMIAAVSFAVALAVGWMTDTSPLGLLSVPMALLFLWAGWAWHGLAVKPWMLWAFVPIAAGGLLFFPPLNMKLGDYGWPIFSVAGAVATSFLIFRAAQWRWLQYAPLRVAGQASLVIMYLHVPVIHYLTPLFAKPLLFALAIILPVAAYFLLRAWSPAAWLFLGQRAPRQRLEPLLSHTG